MWGLGIPAMVSLYEEALLDLRGVVEYEVDLTPNLATHTLKRPREVPVDLDGIERGEGRTQDASRRGSTRTHVLKGGIRNLHFIPEKVLFQRVFIGFS